MSPIAVTLDLLLAGLLILTLGFGMRLERNLKALRRSQADFVGAVTELDQAAARAEAGLAELRTAVDDAAQMLGSRIEKARDLADKLESQTAQAALRQAQAQAAAAARVAAPVTAAVKPAPPPTARATVERVPVDRAPLTLTREQALSPQRRAAPQRPNPRSRALVDDELFEGPAGRAPARARMGL